MTTTFSRVAVSLAALAMTAGLAGCTTSPEKTTQPTDTPTVVAPQVTEVSEAPSTPDAAGQLAALTAYVAGAQAVIPELMGQNPGLYSEIQINGIDDDTIEFAYVYAAQTDTTGATDYFDGMLSTFQSAVDTAVIPEMQQLGISVDPKVRYTYYNADGTLIWSHTFAGS